MPEYGRGFRSAYGRTARREDVLDALAAFQRSLVTPDARFDRYLGGDGAELTPDERRGYELFTSYGCISCHQGANIGGNLFQRFGVFADPFAEREPAPRPISGASPSPDREADRHVFRVPSLRNVAVTAPYLHDGSVATLDEVVAIMGRSQLGIELPRQDIDSIVDFLHSADGRVSGAIARGRRGKTSRDTPVRHRCRAGRRAATRPDHSRPAGRHAGRRRHERTLEAMRTLALSEAALQRDILRTRAGLLRNYDPLVRSVDDLVHAAASLQEAGTAATGNARVEIDRRAKGVVEAVERQAELGRAVQGAERAAAELARLFQPPRQ